MRRRAGVSSAFGLPSPALVRLQPRALGSYTRVNKAVKREVCLTSCARLLKHQKKHSQVALKLELWSFVLSLRPGRPKPLHRMVASG